MGLRKRVSAKKRKEDKKNIYFAKLNNCPSSPRKMRLVADIIRGKDVFLASAILKFTKKEAAEILNKLLKSAISNYEQKSNSNVEESNLFVKEIYVDSGKVLKRIQPAPQGRAHRIKKRSNHVTIIIDKKNVEPQQLKENIEQSQENIEQSQLKIETK